MMMMSISPLTPSSPTTPSSATVKPRQPIAQQGVVQQPLVHPRQGGFELEEDTLIKQALTRTQPESILCAEDLDYRAPLVAFLAGPDAIKKQALKWGALIGTGVGTVVGGITVAVLATSQRNHHIDFMKGAGIVAAGAGVGVLLGALSGWLSGNEAARNQAWVNKNVFEMMDLTCPTATLGQGNKALKAETGDSFSHRLARNESRRRDERTQQMILENQLLTITN
jgi:hypothetical protein